MVMRYVEVNMDVILLNLILILFRLKFGKWGVLVVKIRNCVRVFCDVVCKNFIRYFWIVVLFVVIVCGNFKILIILLWLYFLLCGINSFWKSLGYCFIFELNVNVCSFFLIWLSIILGCFRILCIIMFCKMIILFEFCK